MLRRVKRQHDAVTDYGRRYDHADDAGATVGADGVAAQQGVFKRDGMNISSLKTLRYRWLRMTRLWPEAPALCTCRSRGIHVAQQATNGARRWSVRATNRSAAIVPDLESAGTGWLDVLRGMQSSNITTPVIVPHDSGAVMIRPGAVARRDDDYLRSPLHLDELEARLDALRGGRTGSTGAATGSGPN